MEALLFDVERKDVDATKRLLVLIAERIEDGHALPIGARRYLARALLQIAVKGADPTQALKLTRRRGTPGFGEKQEFMSVMAMGRMRSESAPLTTTGKWDPVAAS